MLISFGITISLLEVEFKKFTQDLLRLSYKAVHFRCFVEQKYCKHLHVQ